MTYRSGVCSFPCLLLASAGFLGLAGSAEAGDAGESREGKPAKGEPRELDFAIRLLTVDANEGIAAGDIDRDGRTDLVAGRHWYRGGDWAPRPLRQIDDWNGYVQSNGDYLFDVNDDGWLDVIAGSFLPTTVHWYENPGAEALRLGHQWREHLLVDTGASANEGQLFEDLDGDGRPEWIVNSWQNDVPMAVWRLEEKQPAGAGDSPQKDGAAEEGAANDGGARYRMRRHQLGPKGNGHGVAVGDLSGDGRPDVLVGQGWYEQPASEPWGQPWTFHADWQLHSSLPMIVTDLDADGDNDLILGNGHDYGLFWWEHVDRDEQGKIAWKKHLIDRSYSQPHTLHWTDLDGDGQEELITGKRYFAHNGGDPGGREMPCLFVYHWDPSAKTFTRQTIDQGRVGTGLQIVAEDLNGDGRTDLAVPGKSGTYLLLAR